MAHRPQVGIAFTFYLTAPTRAARAQNTRCSARLSTCGTMWPMRLLRHTSLILTLVATAAPAWPVDWVHDVEAGKERFLKLPRVDWFEVEDPKVLDVVWQPESNELMLIGLKPGRTTVLLGAEGKVAAWRVRVGTPPVTNDAAYAAAKKACPDLRLTPLEDVKLTVSVHDEACRLALLKYFETDAVEARSLDLAFDNTVLQAQLKSVEDGLRAVTKGRVKARYVGAGLVIEGVTSQAEHRKALWEIFKRALGRFAIDDRIEEPEPDGGAR